MGLVPICTRPLSPFGLAGRTGPHPAPRQLGHRRPQMAQQCRYVSSSWPTDPHKVIAPRPQTCLPGGGPSPGSTGQTGQNRAEGGWGRKGKSWHGRWLGGRLQHEALGGAHCGWSHVGRARHDPTAVPVWHGRSLCRDWPAVALRGAGSPWAEPGGRGGPAAAPVPGLSPAPAEQAPLPRLVSPTPRPRLGHRPSPTGAQAGAVAP